MALTRDADSLFPELRSLLRRLPTDHRTNIPLVLVPGFLGWGSPLLNSFNYFGGFKDIAGTLVDQGWTVIIPQLGPFSSNWERACELYTQLTHGSYDPDIWDVEIDYGTDLQAELPPGQSAVVRERRQAYSLTKGTDGAPHQRLQNWNWSGDHPVHFIAHSQGGNTARYLIHLLRNGKEGHQYFSEPRGEGWVESLVTLCTPHNGTTIINVLEQIDPTGIIHSIIYQAIATASYKARRDRIYNPQLDHWGIAPLPNENFRTMLLRLTAPGGLLQQWFEKNYNAFYDNSIAGVAALNTIIGRPSGNVYYFTLSFGATIRTPPTGILGRLTHWLVEHIPRGIIRPPHDVLQLGPPGSQLPRVDIFPAFPIPSYAMGGYQLMTEQSNILGLQSIDMQQNDGIVNTKSMQGPRGSPIKDVDATLTTLTRGTFYHLGVNDTMDHADAIGIVVYPNLFPRVMTMYSEIADLLSRLLRGEP